jgi:hypothetical protein
MGRWLGLPGNQRCWVKVEEVKVFTVIPRPRMLLCNCSFWDGTIGIESWEEAVVRPSTFSHWAVITEEHGALLG